MSILELVFNNREWLFSGVGVVFTVYIIRLIVPAKKNDMAVSVTIPDGYSQSPRKMDQEQLENKVSEALRISQRLSFSLELINEKRSESSKLTISKLAEIMKLEKVSDLEGFLSGEKEPTFMFIKQFCDILGINELWVKENKLTPFSNNDQPKYLPMDYIDEIKRTNPESIFFVKANTKTAPAIIVLKFSDLHYKILNKQWHISDEVGAGGQSQLVSFYKLIIELRDKSNFYTKCYGLILSENDFNILFSGEKHPSAFIRFTNNPWWDDLTDINHTYPIADRYQDMHGESFIEAQKIIKYKLDSLNQAS